MIARCKRCASRLADCACAEVNRANLAAARAHAVTERDRIHEDDGRHGALRASWDALILALDEQMRLEASR